jgi:hypothetical protein
MEKPEILKRLTRQLRGKGDKEPSKNALIYLRKFGIIEQDSLKLTEKGKKRNEMSPGERAKDRASKYGGRKNDPSDYVYDAKTNQATLRYGKTR